MVILYVYLTVNGALLIRIMRERRWEVKLYYLTEVFVLNIIIKNYSGLTPKIPVPTLTIVLPSSTAISKSVLIPIESSIRESPEAELS